MKALGKHINGKHGETEPKTILLFLQRRGGGEGEKLKRDGDVAKTIQCGSDMKEESLIECYTHTRLLIHRSSSSSSTWAPPSSSYDDDRHDIEYW